MTITDILRATYPDPVEVTGELYVVPRHDRWFNVTGIDYLWFGGDVVSITYELLEDTDQKILKRDGDRVTFLGFELQIIADSPELKKVYLERQG